VHSLPYDNQLPSMDRDVLNTSFGPQLRLNARRCYGPEKEDDPACSYHLLSCHSGQCPVER